MCMLDATKDFDSEFCDTEFSVRCDSTSVIFRLIMDLYALKTI